MATLFKSVECIGLSVTFLSGIAFVGAYAIDKYGYPAGLFVVGAAAIFVLGILWLFFIRVKVALHRIQAARSRQRE